MNYYLTALQNREVGLGLKFSRKACFLPGSTSKEYENARMRRGSKLPKVLRVWEGIGCARILSRSGSAESQISFQLRRRLAGNMARSFANHFARRTVYIGSRIPSQHHRRRVFVDRNEIHFNSAEHNVLDEEPLNSAEYAQRSEPFRSNRGLGERRE